MEWRPDADNDRLAIAILAGFLIARLVFAFSLGLGIDESYSIAISRRLSLSYFDHPPLHLWIAHFVALVVGESAAARVPFIALFFATGWIAYRLARGLFDAHTALIALFGLNVTPFFFASAGSWIVPDGPLLFGLALGAYAAARVLFAAPHDNASAWRLWLVVGIGLGLAGLSKYSAVLSAGGLAAFLIVSPSQRHWLKHPAPYAAAILALAIVTPVIVWNAENGWVSFAFQGGRGVPDGRVHPGQLSIMAIGQIVFLSPWIFAPLVAGLASAFRQRADERRLFLLCLSLPPIVLFTLTPLWGGRGQPHWTMPGWFFAFPLMGVWLIERGVSVAALRLQAVTSSTILAATASVAILDASTGWPWTALTARWGLADPILETFEWRELRTAPILVRSPDFVVATKWSDAGKIALALGPKTPVFVLSNDPRGFAFLSGNASLVGRSGIVVTPATELKSTLAGAAPFFAALGEPQFITLGPRNASAVELALIPASGLTQRLPLPYPVATGR